MTAQAWSEYRLAHFGEPYDVWHDGPDFAAFRAAAREDPATAEQMMLQGLAEGDPLAAQSISEADLPLEIRTRFIPVLEAALDRTNSTFRVRVAEALTWLTGEQRWSSAIVDVLAGGLFWGDRLDAARALGNYQPTVELVAALMRGVQDEEYLVRYHSCDSLLRYSGSTATIYDEKELFEQIANESTPPTRMLAAATLAGRASAALQQSGPT